MLGAKTIQWEKKVVFSTNGAGTTGYSHSKKVDTNITPYTKSNSEWIKE